MAEKLLKYYKYMSDLGGFKSRVELAKLTNIPSVKAAMEPDSPKNIAIFKEAVEKISGRTAPIF